MLVSGWVVRHAGLVCVVTFVVFIVAGLLGSLVIGADK